jgi:hypothetical protein
MLKRSVVGRTTPQTLSKNEIARDKNNSVYLSCFVVTLRSTILSLLFTPVVHEIRLRQLRSSVCTLLSVGGIEILTYPYDRLSTFVVWFLKVIPMCTIWIDPRRESLEYSTMSHSLSHEYSSCGLYVTRYSAVPACVRDARALIFVCELRKIYLVQRTISLFITILQSLLESSFIAIRV